MAQTLADDLLKNIQDIDDQIQHLSRLRARLVRHRNTHLAMISKVHHLPSEILGTIFCIVVDSDIEVTPMKLYRAWLTRFHPEAVTPLELRPHPMTIPLRLSAVCRRWRASALSVSSLWSRFVYYPEYSRDTEPWVAMATAAASRSWQHPLNVHIELKPTDANRDGDEPLRLSAQPLELLSHLSERWKELKLFFSPEKYPALWNTSWEVLAGRVPELESLTVAMNDLDPSHPIIAFRDAPKLQTITLIGVSLSCIDLPWYQIMHASTVWLYFDDISDLLHACPNLARLSWEVHEEEPLYEDIYRIRRPHYSLTSLELNLADPSPLTTLTLGKLELPALQSLSMKATSDNDERDIWRSVDSNLFSTFLSLSPRVEELSLEQIYLSHDDLPVILPFLSNLTTLHLHEPHGSHYMNYLGVVQLLASTENKECNAPIYLPRLETLLYEYNMNTLAHLFSTLAEVIVVRWERTIGEGEAPYIQSVVIVGKETDQHEYVPGYGDLMRLRNGGFDVNFVSI